MEGLPLEIIEDCQDVYALLSKDSGLYATELGKSLRMLNLNPSEQDVKNLLSAFEIQDDKVIEFEEFLKIYKNCKEKCVVNLEEVRNQLSKLDKLDNGFVNTQDLKELLMSGEEPLSLHEAETLLGDFNKDGKIFIKEFLDALIN